MRKIFFLTLLSVLFMKNSNAQNFKTVSEAHGLKIGAQVPMFSALDQDSNTFDLKTALKEKPVVLVFYRGFWCPYCNKHIKSLQDSLKLIEKAGATVIAVSPEKPDYLNKMKSKNGVQFTILYDEDYKIAKAFDVNFLPTKKERTLYNVMLGAKLKKSHSDDSEQLPIPATFLINKDGKIVWRQFDPNYKNRSTVENILKALKEIEYEH